MVETTGYFTLDRARQCRARGHVFERDFRHPNGQFEFQASTECFRCGVTKVDIDISSEVVVQA